MWHSTLDKHWDAYWQMVQNRKIEAALEKKLFEPFNGALDRMATSSLAINVAINGRLRRTR